jgi:hypothetical protein
VSSPEPPPMACAVCARVLMAITIDDAVSYDHEPIDQPADHPAVPAPVDTMSPRYRCDYCTVGQATWTVPARTFQVPGRPVMSRGDCRSAARPRGCTVAGAYLAQGAIRASTAEQASYLPSRKLRPEAHPGVRFRRR